MKKVIFVFLILVSSHLFAWNSLGHRLVAQIAYDNMDSSSKALFNKYNKLLNKKGRTYSLINSSVWLDNLYSEKYKSLRALHYINIPFSTDNTKLPKTNSFNVICAVLIANMTLKNKEISQLDKAIASRILWHVVGDIHQPLHAVTQISKKYPRGDRGGNLVMLPKNKVANNLHSYWDRGGGIFIGKKLYSARDVKRLALQIEKKWPCNLQEVKTDPRLWARESHKISTSFAYSSFSNPNYQKIVQEISEQRVALAGCRLAAIGRNLVF